MAEADIREDLAAHDVHCAGAALLGRRLARLRELRAPEDFRR
jgi:hypothetical protein